MTDSPEAEVGPWAREKLGALSHYLEFYTKVLKKKHWKTIYIDAFAGGGRARIRQAKDGLANGFFEEVETPSELLEFIKGSPRVALDVANPFDSYIFIDADPKRIRLLEAIKDEYGTSRRVFIRPGSASEQIGWALSFKPKKASHRGVAFLDPFGAHLEWDSIVSLAATGVFEVLINFPWHMALNRLMTLNSEIPENWRAQLDAFFPPGWYSHAYENKVDLFGAAGFCKREDARDRVLTFYLDALKAEFGYVASPRLIRNTRGGPLYYLIWAGPHSKGREGADYILRMGDRNLSEAPSR